MKLSTKLSLTGIMLSSMAVAILPGIGVAANLPVVNDANYDQLADRIQILQRTGDIAGEAAIADAVLSASPGSLTDDHYLRLIDYAMQAIGNTTAQPSGRLVTTDNGFPAPKDVVYRADLMRKYALQVIGTGRVTPDWTLDYYPLLVPADEYDSASGRVSAQISESEARDHLALLLQGYSKTCDTLAKMPSFETIGESSDATVRKHLSSAPGTPEEIATYSDLDAGMAQVNGWITVRQLQSNYIRYMPHVTRLRQFSGDEGKNRLLALLQLYVTDPSSREKLVAGMADHSKQVPPLGAIAKQKVIMVQPAHVVSAITDSNVYSVSQEIKSSATTASLEDKEKTIKAVLNAPASALSEDNFEQLACAAIEALQPKNPQNVIRVAKEDPDTIQINDLRRTYALQALSSRQVSAWTTLTLYNLTRDADDYDYASGRVSHDTWRTESLQHLTFLLSGYNTITNQIGQCGNLTEAGTRLDDAFTKFDTIPAEDIGSLQVVEDNLKSGREKAQMWFALRKIQCTYASDLIRSVPQRYFTSQQDLSELTALLQAQVKDQTLLATLLNQINKQAGDLVTHNATGKAA